MIQAIAILFVGGAILGTFGDALHVFSNTLGYSDPAFPLPLTQQPFWVPFLFGAAALGIGLSQPFLSQEFFKNWRKQKAKFLNPKIISIGIITFLLLYAASGYLPLETGGSKDIALFLGAAAIWFVYDRTWQGVLFGASTAVIGSAVEMTLVSQGAFYYLPQQTNMIGVASWLPWLYFAASVTVGNWGLYLTD